MIQHLMTPVQEATKTWHWHCTSALSQRALRIGLFCSPVVSFTSCCNVVSFQQATCYIWAHVRKHGGVAGLRECFWGYLSTGTVLRKTYLEYGMHSKKGCKEQ